MSSSRTARIATAWGISPAPFLPAPDRAPAAGVDPLTSSAAFSHFTESCPSVGSFGQGDAAPAVNPKPTHPAGAVVLSDASGFILSLVAAHEGKSPAEILSLLIAGAAKAIGIHPLILRDAADVDFSDVPDFARRASDRFRGGP